MAGYIGKSQGVVLTDIDNNSVTTADIQDGAVTAAKLDTTYATPAYVDTAEADAVTSANSYTDTAISNIDALPDQTGQSGNYLTTDGTNASWGAVDLSSYATTTALNTAVANSANWDTAYGWGDHSTQNYATTTGDTMTGALNFNDNVNANFGASNDLQIYHSGTGSFIDNAGTGTLFVRGNPLKLQKYTGEAYIDCFNDGAVRLYYDNAQKLTTTSTGVSVTGDLSVSGSIAGAGKVLQMVTATKTDTFSVVGNAYANIPSLSASITPSSTSSKILLIASIGSCSAVSGARRINFRFNRGGSTAILVGDAYSTSQRTGFGIYQPSTSHATGSSFSGVDSPSTTSAITYYLQMQGQESGETYYLNRTVTDGSERYRARTVSTLMLLEIAG